MRGSEGEVGAQYDARLVVSERGLAPLWAKRSDLLLSPDDRSWGGRQMDAGELPIRQSRKQRSGEAKVPRLATKGEPWAGTTSTTQPASFANTFRTRRQAVP